MGDNNILPLRPGAGRTCEPSNVIPAKRRNAGDLSMLAQIATALGLPPDTDFRVVTVADVRNEHAAVLVECRKLIEAFARLDAPTRKECLAFIRSRAAESDL